MRELIPLVEFSFDRDDFDGRDFYDSRRDERRERDRIDDMQREQAMQDYLRDAERDAAMRAMQEVVNNPQIKLDSTMVKAINDPKKVMMSNGTIVTRNTSRGPSQFSRSNLLPNLPTSTKRTRKKTKCDKNLSKALVLANKKFRKKNGKLRKGVTQSQIMKYAHKLCKRM